MDQIDILFIILLSYCVFVLMVCAYNLKRNDWVYRERIKLIYENYKAYQSLPSYCEMMYGHGFWRWDIKYFIKEA